MAVTFPRELPDCRYTPPFYFDLMPYVSANQLYGGQTNVREMAAARWRMEFTSHPMNEADRAVWRAWIDSLRGGVRLFLGYDLGHPQPRAHWGASLDLAGTVTGITATTIAASGFAASLQLNPGDMIGLSNAGKFGLYRSLEAAAGATFNVAVEPQVLTALFPVGSAVTLIKPKCLMTLLADSIKVPSGGGIFPVSFSGIQVPV